MLEHGGSMKYNVIIIALSTLSVCFIVAYSLLLKKFIDIKGKATKLLFDNFTLEKIIELQNDEDLKSDQSVHKENFLKFISESRDWAFNYIEDVQKAISQFVNEVEPEINYFKEYGDIGAMAPNYYSMKKFVEEYEKLKMLLPTEEENK
jgi:hypothetical protein